MIEELIRYVNDFKKSYENVGYIEIDTLDLEDDLTFTVNVITGGASGGSCWDTEEDEGSIEYEGFTDEIDYYHLVKNILSLYKTNVLDDEIYNVIRNIVSEKEDIGTYEYYGNYTDVYRVIIDFKKLPEDISFYLALAS